MDACVFCQIVNGQVESHKIYEDELVFAFLDVHPINPGHVLVIPKLHEPDYFKLDQHIWSSVNKVGQIIGAKIFEKLKPHKVGLVVAGFDVSHTHLHVIPMHKYNDITSRVYEEDTRVSPAKEELAEVAKMFNQ